MPIGTCFHPRTSALCESMSWRDWAGYFAVSSYEVHHEREYNAIRNAAALIDVSPLFKYRVSGKDATRLVDRIVTRDVPKMKVGQVAYTHWCDGQGKVVDDGTVSRLADDVYRWTAADPSLRWIRMNAHGLDVKVEDISDRLGALALQGPTSRSILEACVEGADIAKLKYFRVTRRTIAGIPVEISRTGYTGDLGYEIWVEWDNGPQMWDALMAAGRPFDITPTGMLALDVARIEAGLILLDVDYVGARKAIIPSQKYSPFEIGLGRLVAWTRRRSSASRRCGARPRTAPSASWSASRWTGTTSSGCTTRRACPRSCRSRRRACRCPSTGTARRWGRPPAARGRRP